MDLDAKPLQYFAAVAREASFSRAARKLNVSQPALSAQIRELERRLGFDLFARTSRSVELTREGRLFLREALQTIAETARLRRAARDIRDNDLRLNAALYTVLIPERLALIDGFSDAYPGIALAVENRDQTRAFNHLRRGDLDLALVIGLVAGPGQPEGAASEIVLPADFERLDLCLKPIELLVPAESALAGRSRIPLAALAGQQIAMLGAYHGGELIEVIAAPLEAAGADLIAPPEGNAIAVERYARRRRIPAVSLGWFDYPRGAGPDMVRRPVEGLDAAIALALIRPQGGLRRPACDLFWAFAAKMFPPAAGSAKP